MTVCWEITLKFKKHYTCRKNKHVQHVRKEDGANKPLAKIGGTVYNKNKKIIIIIVIIIYRFRKGLLLYKKRIPVRYPNYIWCTKKIS